ncbi:MAG: NAD-glutamate dehydrogenase [Alphaproteobacteria bacterium]
MAQDSKISAKTILGTVMKMLAPQLDSKGAAARLFAEALFGAAVPEALADMEPETLEGIALSLFQFAQTRTLGQAKVRAYTPTQATHGWTSSHSVVEIVNDDMPFLVDSVVAALNRRNLIVHLLIHPILMIRRDDATLVEMVSASRARDPKFRPESVMHIQIDQQASAQDLAAIEADLTAVLADVRQTVSDWQKMRDAADRAARNLINPPPGIDAEEAAEVKAFLDWLRADRFTFLGVREYRLVTRNGQEYLDIIEGSGLGLLKTVSAESIARHEKPLTPEEAEFAKRRRPLVITKASSRATVHRPVYMDYLGLRQFDSTGTVTGEVRILGLFSSAAYITSVDDIPLLRRKASKVMARAGFPPGSHNAKALQHILETYPRDELLQIEDDTLFDFAQGIRQLEERQRVRLFLRHDDHARFLSCLVYTPRDRYTTEIRRRYEKILSDALDSEQIDFTTSLTEAPMARLHFIVRTPAGAPQNIDVTAIEDKLAEATRAWADGLKSAFIAKLGEARGLELHSHYETAFPAAYRDAYTPETAVDDAERIEAMLNDSEVSLGFNLHQQPHASEGIVNFKTYRLNAPLYLSAALPILESMGAFVLGESPFAVRPAHCETPVFVQDFEMRAAIGSLTQISALRDRFETAFARIWSGVGEIDGFNRLIIAAGLDWQAIVVLRAYGAYLRQAGIPFRQRTVEDALTRNPLIAADFCALFRAKFDPDRDRAQAAQEIATLDARILANLEKVVSLDEDRILRRYLNLLHASVRTNFFRPAKGEPLREALAIKLDSHAVAELPAPKPFREIFVYSPRLEAIHLRGGKVARGGLRWSDRPTDFRTEVLSLMKAQMVKNAVIVPVGSKGGFVLKRAPQGGDRKALLEEGIACYKIFIRSLLDITDNLDADGKPVPPPRTVRHDEDDPYLVVAADKGTATFSDYANAISEEYGFWLGDAFASGGSAGYDHKKMGITARGAWEGVKRHFREMGQDIQSEDFTVVGVGDMGGDVFGNGMLLSHHIRLIAAFNHRHIFIDPAPDSEKSWQERKRLFDAVQGWDGYDTKLISKGGGVFERSVKSITVSPEMKILFEITQDRVTPDDLIRAILCAKIDLLWFGGIGTYIKSTHESHEDVGDRANDTLRIDAAAVRAKAIGEGANLAVTQAARVDYALSGGRCNTDAIDNSAGVDCSDHEVNIKILLGDPARRGTLTRPQRDALLVEMTEEVADLVLRDNYLQTQAISDMEAQGAGALDSQHRLIRDLERAGKLDRLLEGLPDDETLAARGAIGRGLMRPELAVLLAYAKTTLYDDLLHSDLPEDPGVHIDLPRYFPKVLVQKFTDAMERHRLHREILATMVTNSLINRTGPTFINDLCSDTGCNAAEIARGYTIARDAFNLRQIWQEIEALDGKVATTVQSYLRRATQKMLEETTRWLLSQDTALSVAAGTKKLAAVAHALTGQLDRILDPATQQIQQAQIERLISQKVPADLAQRIADLPLVAEVCLLSDLAEKSNRPIMDIAQIWFDLSARLKLGELRNVSLPQNATALQKTAFKSLLEDMISVHRQLILAVLQVSPKGRCEEFFMKRPAALATYDQVMADLKSTPGDLAPLTVAVRRLRALFGHHRGLVV